MFSPIGLAVDGQRVRCAGWLAESPSSPPAGRRRSRSPPSGTGPRACRLTRQGSSLAEPVQVLERQLDADAAGDRDQVDHRIGRAADRGQRLDRVLERLRASGSATSVRSSCTISTMRRPAMRASTLRRRVDRRDRRRCRAGRGRAPRPCRPSSRPCPWSCSGRGCGACSSRRRRSPASLIVPARTCSLMLHTPVPEPSSWPRNLPLSIGPPETPIVGRSHARRAHHAAKAWSCRSPSAAPRRRSDCRGSTPRRPCWRGCGTASRSGAAGSRRATSPGTRAGSRRPRRRRLDLLGQRRGNASCRA